MICSVYSDKKVWCSNPTELWTHIRAVSTIRTWANDSELQSDALPTELRPLMFNCAIVGIEPHITDFYSSTLSRAADFRLVNPDCTGRLQSPIYCDKPAFNLYGRVDLNHGPLPYQRSALNQLSYAHIWTIWLNCKFVTLLAAHLPETLYLSYKLFLHSYRTVGAEGFEPPKPKHLIYSQAKLTAVSMLPILECRAGFEPAWPIDYGSAGFADLWWLNQLTQRHIIWFQHVKELFKKKIPGYSFERPGILYHLIL